MIGLDEPLVMDGKSYYLAPLTADQVAALQAWVTAHLPDPIARARDIARDLPPAESAMIMQGAIDEAANGYGMLGTAEADAALTSLEGFTEQLFRAGQKHHPEMTRDDWRRLVDHLLAEAMDPTD